MLCTCGKSNSVPVFVLQLRNAANESRDQQIITLQLMKNSRVTADHILGVMVPMILAALDRKVINVCSSSTLNRLLTVVRGHLDKKLVRYILQIIFQSLCLL